MPHAGQNSLCTWKWCTPPHKETNGLPGAFHRNDGKRRSQDNPDVHPRTPVQHIMAIQRHATGIVGVAPSARLPKPGDARLGPGKDSVPVAIVGNLVFHNRTRPDHRHVAREHVEKLGQFIKRRLPENRAYGRDAWIVLQLEVGLPLGLERWIVRKHDL